MNTALSLGYKSYPQEVVVMETTRNAGSCCGHHGATSAHAHRTAAVQAVLQLLAVLTAKGRFCSVQKGDAPRKLPIFPVLVAGL